MLARASVVLVDVSQNIQAAIDALPASGGRIQLAPGSYDITAAAPLRIRRGVELVGEGWSGWGESNAGGPWDSPVKILCTDKNKDIIDLVDAPFCRLENLQLVGASASGTGTQIGIKSGPSANPIMAGITLVHVLVQNCSSHGVQFKNNYLTECTKLFCVNNLGDGCHVAPPDTIAGQTPTNPHYLFDNCWFLGNSGYGFWGSKMGPGSFRSCSFQASLGAANCYLEFSTDLNFDCCNWEQTDTTSGHNALVMAACATFRVSGNFTAESPGSAGVGKAIVLTDCHHFDLDNLYIDCLLNTTGVIQLNKSSTGCYAGAIGWVNMPNHGAPFFDTGPTPGTDWYNINAKYVQTFASETTRDTPTTPGFERPLKIVGERIYVLTPGSSPTHHEQTYNGSAWINTGSA